MTWKRLTRVRHCISQDWELKLTSFSYGIPRKANGKRVVRVVCTMADVTETPQTVPKDLMRYTVEADTA